jgi:catechol 2,3-dioxygenase-like lactoylglutathione lyase family enzyme
MQPLQHSRIIAFVAVTDFARARKFYEDVLGLSFTAEEPFALIFQTSTGMLRLSKVVQLTPAPYTVLGWEVSDIHAEVKALIDRGVVFERFEMFAHNEAGVFTFPNGDQVAWFKDPDGNTLSLTQFK